MSALLAVAIALVRGWTRLYTCRMEPEIRDRRYAEIESDLWEFHEDARRGGLSAERIALHMIARLVTGIVDDLRWRVECADAGMHARRRAAWMTAAAAAGAVCVGALWALFWITSIVSLPPLPEPGHIERVRGFAPPPPPPPPPPLRGVRPAFAPRLGPPPPPPPPAR
jgi:hypothetical protein